MGIMSTISAAYVPDKNLNGLVLELDAVGGTTVNTSVWTALIGNNATLINSPSYKNYNEGVIELNKTNSHAANIASLGSALTNFTVEAWVYVTAFPGPESGYMACFVTEEFTGTDDINFFMGFLNPNNGLVEGGFFKAGSGFAKAGTFVASLNTWYHFVTTFDGSAVKLYVNGILNQSVATALVPGTGGRPISLGRKWDTFNDSKNYFSGFLPIVRVYNRALSNVDVLSNYRSLEKRYRPSLTNFKQVYADDPTSFAYIAMPNGGSTLLTYLSSFGVTASSQADGTSLWLESFSGNLAYIDQPRTGNNYFSQHGRVRIIESDGFPPPGDVEDWVVFNFGNVALTTPDYNNATVVSQEAFFGGETIYSGGLGGTSASVGEIWGYNTSYGWMLLYRLPLGTTNSLYTHVNGYWFTTGTTVTSGFGKRTEYNTVSISHLGFTVK
jgi:hypothetical protein